MIAVPLAAMIIVAGWYISQDPSKVEPYFDLLNDYTHDTINDAPIVPLQEDESWLVVVVDFPNAPVNGFRNIEKAGILLTGTNGADDYLSQTSGGLTNLSVSIFPEVYHSQNNDGYWGKDDGDVRDAGEDGSNGPAGLAESVIKNSFNGYDLSQFDLNSDGWIDRLLLLHTGNVQEDSGSTSNIWSHFGHLEDTVEVGDYKFDHYTIAGFDSGFGTIMHEMLHQMGALDIYDVHGLGTGDDWNGVGDWDIMASGNWNGANGRTPALPSLATMDLIGLDRATEVSISSTGQIQEYILSPLSDGGDGLFIQISPSEKVWMSYRADIGFDKKLPGHGLLVTLQDSAVGDSEQNLVNTDPDNPWLYVLESDGDSGLLSGNDKGSAGDVFSPSQKFGAEGIQIIDHYGRIVNWTAEVVSMDSNFITINISSQGVPTFDVIPPHKPIQLLGNEDLIMHVESSVSCQLESNIISSDGRIVTIVEDQALIAGNNEVRTLRWDSEGVAGSEGRLEGSFNCGNSAPLNISMEFHNIGLRLNIDTFEKDIHYSEQSYFHIPLSFDGDGFQTWEVRIEGPLERITSTKETQNLGEGSELNITVEPNGLLVPGMVARGELIIRDSQGLEQESEIILTAEKHEKGGEIARFLSEPSNIIITISVLLALSVLLSIKKRKSVMESIINKGQYQAKKEIALEFENSVVEYYDEINPPKG